VGREKRKREGEGKGKEAIKEDEGDETRRNMA